MQKGTENLAQTTWDSRMGKVLSSSIVPLLRSLAMLPMVMAGIKKMNSR